jgi:hypothetical protein
MATYRLKLLPLGKHGAAILGERVGRGRRDNNRKGGKLHDHDFNKAKCGLAKIFNKILCTEKNEIEHCVESSLCTIEHTSEGKIV